MPVHPIYEAVKWLNYMLEQHPDDGSEFLTRLLEPTFSTTDIDLAENSPFQFGVAPLPTDRITLAPEPTRFILSGLGIINGCFTDNYVIAAQRYCNTARDIAGFKVAKIDPDSGKVTVMSDAPPEPTGPWCKDLSQAELGVMYLVSHATYGVVEATKESLAGSEDPDDGWYSPRIGSNGVRMNPTLIKAWMKHPGDVE